MNLECAQEAVANLVCMCAGSPAHKIHLILKINIFSFSIDKNNKAEAR